jgi:hypothetical protein
MHGKALQKIYLLRNTRRNVQRMRALQKKLPYSRYFRRQKEATHNQGGRLRRLQEVQGCVQV